MAASTAGSAAPAEGDRREGDRRPRSARGEGDSLRDDLLRAAADLMATHGTLDGISLRAVARRAGVSPTAVYRHFDDHPELLREAVVHCWSNFHRTMVEARASSDDPYVAFANAGDAYVRFALEQRGQYRVLFSNAIDLDLAGGDHRHRGDAPAATADSVGMAAFQVLVDMVTEILQARGDDRDPTFVAGQVHTWIHGIVDLCGTHPEAPWPPMRELLGGLRDALGLAPPAPERREPAP